MDKSEPQKSQILWKKKDNHHLNKHSFDADENKRFGENKSLNILLQQIGKKKIMAQQHDCVLQSQYIIFRFIIPLTLFTID